MVRRRGILGEFLRGGTDRVGLGDPGMCIDSEGPKRGPCTRGPAGVEDTGVAEKEPSAPFVSDGRSYTGEMGESVGSAGRPKVGGGCVGGGRGRDEDDDEACCMPDPFDCRLARSGRGVDVD